MTSFRRRPARREAPPMIPPRSPRAPQEESVSSQAMLELQTRQDAPLPPIRGTRPAVAARRVDAVRPDTWSGSSPW